MQVEIKELFSFLLETFKIVVIALLIVIPIRYFLFQPFIVKGDSMLPNFEQGDYLLIDEISFRLRDPKRGEVVVFIPPNNSSSRYIKRIVGLPGETIQIGEGKVMIKNQAGESYVLNESSYLPAGTETLLPAGESLGNINVSLNVSLKENEYFVLGDNRGFSSDSRIFGVLSKENITGRVFFRAFPFNHISRIEIPAY